MNTSNKMLAGFFLIVFIVPALMVMAFKSKIRRNDYKMVNRESVEDGHWKTGNLKTPKVVKLVGASPNVLTVNISRSDNASFGYGTNEGDSLRIITTGDTLQVNCTRARSNDDDNWSSRIYLNLSLPHIEKLIAENAEVNFNSIDTSSAISLTIEAKGISQVNFGTVSEQTFPEPGSRHAIKLARLEADVDNSSLNLGQEVTVTEMAVRATGASRLFIAKDAAIGNVTGTVSDNTRVDAAWNFLKELKPAAAQ